MAKMRCLRCRWFCFDFFDQRYERGSFCGMHGRSHVDPNGVQENLDKRGSCGYTMKKEPVQLTLTFDA